MTAPTRIGRYEIVRRLGRSMTDVYLAIDTVANRKAALKLIRCGGNTASQLVLEAERRGAAIQQQLHTLDPRMVEIYEFGEQDGWFFVAMQYVEGHNVAEVLGAEHTIDPLRAAAIALEICEQLVKFHSWEPAVVHGDIKPSNIHLGYNDTVRLLDFGIAKTLRVDQDDTNHNFGSPSYCSPERLIRSAVDPQSDLWALGATLYEMLSGAPPYQADDTRKLESLIRSRRAPRALPDSCPRALSAIVSKALAPDQHRRYRSARHFQADLQAFLEHRIPVAQAELAKRARWNPNSTLEAARGYWRRATRTMARVKVRGVNLPSALGWFALGMLLWVGCALTLQAWRARAVTAEPPVPAVSPPAAPKSDLPLLYATAARRILESYRNSTDPSLHNFDWHKAELCLEHAIELGGVDDRTLGELALSRGYATLERLSGDYYSPAAATKLRDYARAQFMQAAERMPLSPDPHLALARLYVYSFPDTERAMAEFDQAERMGAVLGQRDFAQQADAYRIVPVEKAARTVSARRVHRKSHLWR